MATIWATQSVSDIASLLNPILNNPILYGTLLPNLSLKAGVNSVNHTLNRTLQGWIPVRVRGNSSLWDSQNQNKTPALTLNLNASNPVVIDLFVF